MIPRAWDDSPPVLRMRRRFVECAALVSVPVEATDEVAAVLVAECDRHPHQPGSLSKPDTHSRAIGTKERRRITLGHGRTAAGTRFEVSSGSGPLGALGSCHRSAAVAYTRPGAPEVLIVGVPNNPICLSLPRYRHPALFCEADIETIQTAVPASVRSVRLVLADGRTIESRVVRVPRRDGGPAGIYAQEIRGSTSHAVSLVELNAGKSVVLTLKLPRYRCVKSRKEPEGLPTGTELASGHTPGTVTDTPERALPVSADRKGVFDEHSNHPPAEPLPPEAIDATNKPLS
jgi:hypothetical protein